MLVYCLHNRTIISSKVSRCSFNTNNNTVEKMSKTITTNWLIQSAHHDYCTVYRPIQLHFFQIWTQVSPFSHTEQIYMHSLLLTIINSKETGSWSKGDRRIYTRKTKINPIWFQDLSYLCLLYFFNLRNELFPDKQTNIHGLNWRLFLGLY